MSSPTIADVVDGLCAVIAATGTPAVPLTDRPVLPCVLVYPDSSIGGNTYFKTMRGGVLEVPIVCMVAVSTVDLAGQQRLLLDAISPWSARSIPLAILENPTLGTADDENTGTTTASMSAHVTSVDEFGFALLADGTRVLQAKVRVTVKLTRGAA